MVRRVCGAGAKVSLVIQYTFFEDLAFLYFLIGSI